MILINVDSPRDLQFIPEDTNYYPGDVIRCMASANPPAEIHWIDLNTGTMIPGDLLHITADMANASQSYQCVANNTIKEVERNKTRTHNFRVIGDYLL